MPHDHAHHHHHHHVDPAAGDARVALAFVLNLGLSLAEMAGGLLSGSVALIADGAHNLSDAASLGLAWWARRIARRPCDGRMTFGYGRAEAVSALVNYVALIVVSLSLMGEGLWRLFSPPEVAGLPVMALAGLALAVNLATVALTWAMAKASMNIRAAFIHNVSDAATSVVVIVTGGLIWAFGWHLADPIATILVSGWILWQTQAELRPVIRLLMLGTPEGLAAETVLGRIGAVEGVEEVHHLHLWMIDEHEASVEAHLVLRDPGVAQRVRSMLEDEFGIDHATFALETPEHRCRGAAAIGHAAE